jgi:hypothetical protein
MITWIIGTAFWIGIGYGARYAHVYYNTNLRGRR